MSEKQTFLKKHNKKIVILLLIIIAIFFLFGSPKGWNMAEKYLDQFEIIEKQNLKKIKDSILVSEENHKLYVDSIKSIEVIFIPNQNNEINRLRNENKALLQEIDSIKFAFNSKRRLDSFAEFAKYK